MISTRKLSLQQLMPCPATSWTPNIATTRSAAGRRPEPSAVNLNQKLPLLASPNLANLISFVTAVARKATQALPALNPLRFHLINGASERQSTTTRIFLKLKRTMLTTTTLKTMTLLLNLVSLITHVHPQLAGVDQPNQLAPSPRIPPGSTADLMGFAYQPLHNGSCNLVLLARARSMTSENG